MDKQYQFTGENGSNERGLLRGLLSTTNIMSVCLFVCYAISCTPKVLSSNCEVGDKGLLYVGLNKGVDEKEMLFLIAVSQCTITSDGVGMVSRCKWVQSAIYRGLICLYSSLFLD